MKRGGHGLRAGMGGTMDGPKSRKSWQEAVSMEHPWMGGMTPAWGSLDKAYILLDLPGRKTQLPTSQQVTQ